MTVVSSALWLLLAVPGLAVLAGVRRVPTDTVCTLHRFGRYVRALAPGLHFTWPLADRIAARISLVGHQVELADGRCQGIVYFQILDPQRTGQVLEQVDAMVEREARRRLTLLLGAAAADDVVGLASRLKQDLNGQLGSLGLRVTRCQLRAA